MSMPLVAQRLAGRDGPSYFCGMDVPATAVSSGSLRSTNSSEDSEGRLLTLPAPDEISRACQTLMTRSDFKILLCRNSAQSMRSGVAPINAGSLISRTRKLATSARLITPNRQSFDAVRTR
jgi:hypothetical protein